MNSINITLSLLEKIERANAEFALFDNCSGILVGLSGGADSTCLLIALKALSDKYGFSLCAVHVNHMIRKGEADRDEMFAKELCEKHGVEFCSRKVDVPAFAEKEGISLELCARNKRYEIFADICKEKGLSHVATAHNLCDNAETVLFNVIRGSGTKGLCGIPPKRMLDKNITVIRPLLGVHRGEIEEYLNSLGQDYVTDSTNKDNDYTRNYLRNTVIPELKRINPSLEESLFRTSGLHRKDEQYLTSCAIKETTDEIARLCILHESVLSRVVMELFSHVSGETPQEHHIKNLCRAIYEYDGLKKRVSFAAGYEAVLFRGKISFRKDKRVKAEKKIEFDVKLREGAIFFEENPYALYINFDKEKDIPQILENNENIYKKYTTDYLYFDTIPDVLHIRNRRDGDKIFSGKMHRNVKRVFLSSDYQESERYLVPFVCENEKILLIPGVSKCDDCGKQTCKERIAVSLFKRQ